MVWGGREGGGGGRVVQPLSISKVLQLGIHVGKEKGKACGMYSA